MNLNGCKKNSFFVSIKTLTETILPKPTTHVRFLKFVCSIEGSSCIYFALKLNKMKTNTFINHHSINSTYNDATQAASAPILSIVYSQNKQEPLKIENALLRAGVGLWEYTINDNKLLITDGYANILGYDMLELSQLGTNGLLEKIVHPEDAGKLQSVFVKMRAGNIHEFQLTLRMLHKNGTYLSIWNTGNVSELNTNGKPCKFTGIIKETYTMSTQENENSKLVYELRDKNEKYEERIKLQHLLYTIFNLLNNNRNVHVTLSRTVNLIPSGCRMPNDVCARITFNGKSYESSDFMTSVYSLESSFETLLGKRGTVEIFYNNEITQSIVGPSFKESPNLTDTLATMLKSWLDKRETELSMQNMLVELEGKIEERTEEIKKTNSKLLTINKDINDSINYANRIQRAILPTEAAIKRVFDDAFVLYMPKDTVSGDFYWMHKTEDKIFYACADCTGHGVPGALMSMVGNQLLDHIISDRNIHEADLILKEIDKSITRMFKKGNIEEGLRDGMTISLCVVDKSKNSISFAGAGNNAYVVRNKELIVLEAEHLSIGGHGNEAKHFKKIKLSYKKGDSLYMFTDGFPDQFGGEKGKKLMRKTLLNMIIENSNAGMDKQKMLFENAFTKWKGNHFQVDDVTLLGVKL